MFARTEWKKYNTRGILNLFYESKAGLNYARERGVAVAMNECIIFCDDDNWLDKHYLKNAFTIMNNDLTIGALGGQSKAAFETSIIPIWFEADKESYAVGKQAAKTGNINHIGHVWGAGQVTRKSLYLKAFQKIPYLLTDRKGTTLSSGGDTEYCCRLMLMKYNLYFDESLNFIHFIPQVRLSEDYQKRLHIAFNESHQITILYHLMLAVKKASFNKRISLCFKSLIKRIISYLKLSDQINSDFDSIIIYFITGFCSKKILPQAKRIYEFAHLIEK